MGVGEILQEWTAWRTDCIKRRLFFQIQKKQERLHLLKGLERILLILTRRCGSSGRRSWKAKWCPT